MKKKIFVLLTVATLISACQSEKAPMFVKLPAIPFCVEGTHADLIKGANSEWFFLRDSVANEETDTIYNVTVDAKLKVEKMFTAEKLDTFPQLKFFSPSGEELIVMDVQDSAVINDFVGYYLKERLGFNREIRFVGKINKSKYLQLAQAQKAVLVHFSLYDPEAHADPQITALLDEYETGYENVKSMVDDGIPLGSTMMMRVISTMDDVAKNLKSKEKQMSPAQLKRYHSTLAKIKKLR